MVSALVLHFLMKQVEYFFHINKHKCNIYHIRNVEKRQTNMIL